MLLRVLIIFGMLVPAVAQAAPERPNIVLILADDVGREVLGCYGGQSYQTPQIDSLARAGKRFTHCYSMPVCHPSRICLLTGRYPTVLGNPPWGSFPSELEPRTFASLLQKGGYATAIAGKWQLALLKDDPRQPARMGFDQWSLFGWHEGPRYHDPLIYENGVVRTDTKGKFGPDLYVDFLVDFIRQNKSGPFLAYYSMALCHDVTNDLDAPVPYGPKGRWMNYHEMAEEMDRQVGRLVAALDEMKLRDNTLIVFTTDNGTAAASYLKFEDGKYVRPKVFSKWNGREVQGGKGQLADLGTRVPLIANWPGHIAADSVCHDLVDFSDFLPTLLEVAHVPLPESPPINGHSFAASLFGTGKTTRRWAYSESDKKGQYVRTRRYKLYSTGEYIDMKSDPDEQRPLTENQLTDQAQSVKKELQAALDTLKPAR